jgi:hypothetical protein
MNWSVQDVQCALSIYTLYPLSQHVYTMCTYLVHAGKCCSECGTQHLSGGAGLVVNVSCAYWPQFVVTVGWKHAYANLRSKSVHISRPTHPHCIVRHDNRRNRGQMNTREWLSVPNNTRFTREKQVTLTCAGLGTPGYRLWVQHVLTNQVFVRPMTAGRLCTLHTPVD